jgi:hypothetical protein
MVCIDDIFIFSWTVGDHLNHLDLILARLRQHRLFSKLSTFNRASLPFLGHVVGHDGVKMYQSKVQALDELPRLTTVPEVQSFQGLANYYRRFIRYYAVSPLRYPTSPRKASFWTGGEQEISFQNLRDAVKSAPVLQLADSSMLYIASCNASEIGIGAVFEQDSENGPHPVAFDSRKLSSAKINFLCTNGSYSQLSKLTRNCARTCMVVVSSSKRIIIH